ncbi:RES domain-containing protein [Anatilimnocola floriformis]|uniref:RES domain-containing protein n=1 Tax=Anatilimnocola floriformis TaxID=2948575 RepID=UPI0020C1CCA4|nr:RES domain-containing protein [Anatilimnocola floriformis]
MKLKDFLSHAEIKLPITRDSDDFQAFVETKLDQYLALVKGLSDPADIAAMIKARLTDIEGFCNAAKEVIKATLAGHPHDAYSHFITAVTPLMDCIDEHTLSAVPGDLGCLYRVRRQSSPSLTREEMFHIPFEKRHLVATQRYSIPGLPCLYLAGSLYTCWAEMGRPPFHELHAAAYWLKKSAKVKILNLSNRPARVLLYLDPDGNPPLDAHIRRLVANHVVLWPLLAMCSLVVKHRDSPYKPEYIFPQTILQWITKEHEFDGVCYFSTHVDAVTSIPLPPCNFVFPARQIKAKGRCGHLRSIFKMTSPHGWQLLSAIQAGEGMPGGVIPIFDFVFVDGRKEPYHATEFGGVQAKLNKLARDIRYTNESGDPALGDLAD